MYAGADPAIYMVHFGQVDGRSRGSTHLFCSMPAPFRNKKARPEKTQGRLGL